MSEIEIDIDDRLVHRFGQGSAQQADVHPVMGGFRQVGAIDPVYKYDFIGVYFMQEILLDIPVLQGIVLFREEAEIHVLEPFKGGVFPGLLLPAGESFCLKILEGF